MSAFVTPAFRRARALALGVPVALLGGALISQYGFGLYPCEMCWWQRYPHMLAIPLALLSFWRPVPALVAVAGLFILASGLIGGFHAGVEYGWWQGVTACSSQFMAGNVDPLEAIMNAPVIRCDVAPWSLFGVSLAGWNFVVSAAGAVAIWSLIALSGKAKR